MEYDNVSFPEALKELAGRIGIDLSPYEGRGGSRSDDFDLLLNHVKGLDAGRFEIPLYDRFFPIPARE